MRKLLLLSICCIAIGTIHAGGPTLHWLAGNWEGTGGSVNYAPSWTITLNYKEDDKSIKLAYPSHNCGGSLKIKSIENGMALCVEDLNYGLDGGCITGLDVMIKQESDGSITVTYYYLGTTTVKSVAKLKRV